MRAKARNPNLKKNSNIQTPDKTAVGSGLFKVLTIFLFFMDRILSIRPAKSLYRV